MPFPLYQPPRDEQTILCVEVDIHVIAPYNLLSKWILLALHREGNVTSNYINITASSLEQATIEKRALQYYALYESHKCLSCIESSKHKQLSGDIDISSSVAELQNSRTTYIPFLEPYSAC